ncbi:MAG: 5-(carboxyamino)imidazole ribonucleotide mutase [Myxococcota bacterium]|nr:5-(carboxyamino)imidazole ribonucleotide mutase [Myxococcota bacterium]
MTKKIDVGIVMGSKSDLPVMQKVADVLDTLDIGYEMRILSAHRTPLQAKTWAETAKDRGIQVLICGAGMAAHLAGAVAAHSLLPVIGVPLGATLGGVDSLLSTVQMPPGVPVATVGIGSGGAKNAAWLAARIISVHDSSVEARMKAAIEDKRNQVLAQDAELQK